MIKMFHELHPIMKHLSTGYHWKNF